MKIILFMALLCLNNSILAQDLTKLPDSYLLNRRNLEDGKPLEIIKLTNYKLYTQRRSDSVKSLEGKSKSYYYDNAFNEEKVKLSKGNYYIDNVDFYFRFDINEKNLLDNNAFLNLKDKDSQTDLVFQDGIAIKTKTKIKGQLYSETFLLDSIFTSKEYQNNILIRNEEINLKLGGGGVNSIFTRYYDDGKLLSIQNNIEKTFVVYSENGKIERETNEKNNSGKFFDDEGNLELKYYEKDNFLFQEYYSKGVISSKVCTNKDERKEYSYDNGKLESYEVYNFNTKKFKSFNSKGVEIQGNKTPSIMMN